ncbi:DUF4190 domain-containing protein [Candidatus Saccharibacteria bacterium]|nr:DUF4190 domain-containing protein [Candidatus Saccharibacteria bacterium]
MPAQKTKKAPDKTRRTNVPQKTNASKKSSVQKNTDKSNCKKTLAIIGIIVPAAFILITTFYWPTTKTGYYVRDVVALLAGIIGIVLSRIGKSQETKKLATAGLIVSIIDVILMVSDLMTVPYISKILKNCEVSDDGTTAICEMEFGGQKTKVPTPIPIYFIEEEEK